MNRLGVKKIFPKRVIVIMIQESRLDTKFEKSIAKSLLSCPGYLHWYPIWSTIIQRSSAWNIYSERSFFFSNLTPFVHTCFFVIVNQWVIFEAYWRRCPARQIWVTWHLCRWKDSKSVFAKYNQVPRSVLLYTSRIIYIYIIYLSKSHDWTNSQSRFPIVIFPISFLVRLSQFN